MNYLLTSLLMTFIDIFIVAIWKSRQAFREYAREHMPLWADKLPISHNNVVGENQLNILETGSLVVQNSSPTRLRLVTKMFRWRTYHSLPPMIENSNRELSHLGYLARHSDRFKLGTTRKQVLDYRPICLKALSLQRVEYTCSCLI